MVSIFTTLMSSTTFLWGFDGLLLLCRGFSVHLLENTLDLLIGSPHDGGVRAHLEKVGESALVEAQHALLLDDVLEAAKGGSVLGLQHTSGVGLSHEALADQVEGVSSLLRHGASDAAKSQEVEGSELAFSGGGGVLKLLLSAEILDPVVKGELNGLEGGNTHKGGGKTLEQSSRALITSNLGQAVPSATVGLLVDDTISTNTFLLDGQTSLDEIERVSGENGAAASKGAASGTLPLGDLAVLVSEVILGGLEREVLNTRVRAETKAGNNVALPQSVETLLLEDARKGAAEGVVAALGSLVDGLSLHLEQNLGNVQGGSERTRHDTGNGASNQVLTGGKFVDIASLGGSGLDDFSRALHDGYQRTVEVQVVIFKLHHIRLLSLSPPQAQRLHAARVLATPELGTQRPAACAAASLSLIMDQLVAVITRQHNGTKGSVALRAAS
jgi:hypothetical protein